MTPDDKEIAEAIKALRAELGESQQKFSDRLGVVVRTIARYELEKAPNADVLLRLASIAGKADRQDLRMVFYRAYTKRVSESWLSRPVIAEEFGRPYFAPYLDLLLALLIFDHEAFEWRLSRFLHSEVDKAIDEFKQGERALLPAEIDDLRELAKKLKK